MTNFSLIALTRQADQKIKRKKGGYKTLKPFITPVCAQGNCCSCSCIHTHTHTRNVIPAVSRYMTAIVPVVMILGPEGLLLQSLKPLVNLWAERKLDFLGGE